jgi:hypothetical protein
MEPRVLQFHRRTGKPHARKQSAGRQNNHLHHFNTINESHLYAASETDCSKSAVSGMNYITP